MWKYFWPGLFCLSLLGMALFQDELERKGRSGRVFLVAMTAFLTFFAISVVITNSAGAPDYIG